MGYLSSHGRYGDANKQRVNKIIVYYCTFVFAGSYATDVSLHQHTSSCVYKSYFSSLCPNAGDLMLHGSCRGWAINKSPNYPSNQIGGPQEKQTYCRSILGYNISHHAYFPDIAFYLIAKIVTRYKWWKFRTMDGNKKTNQSFLNLQEAIATTFSIGAWLCREGSM